MLIKSNLIYKLTLKKTQVTTIVAKLTLAHWMLRKCAMGSNIYFPLIS